MKINSLSPKEYEAFVAQLVSKLDFAANGEIRRNTRFAGVRQPGRYEIDVSVKIQLAEALKFFLIIECKNWTKPVGREVVQKLAQTREAISADKAAIASPVGFTKEASEVARALGVALWVITLDEWVVTYDNGAQRLELKLIEKERGRDWAADPAEVHISDWGSYALATFNDYKKIPSHLSWARFCNLNRWNRDQPLSELKDTLIRRVFKDEPSDRFERRANRRGGVGHGLGDASLVHTHSSEET